MEGIPHALSKTRAALETTAEMLHELTPAATRSVANLDVSVAAFRTTIDREFHEAARLHYRASKMLADAATDVSDSAQSLKTVAVDSFHTNHAAVPATNGDAPHTDHTPPNGTKPR